MKRLFAIMSVFLSLLFSTNAVAMSDSEKQRYLDFVKEKLDNYDDTSYIALGMAPDGCWAVGYHNNPSGANRSAIKKCKKHCDASSCEVVDRNGRSDFIKAKGMPFPVGFGKSSGSSSSSSSSSDVAYCLSKKYRRFLYINMSGGCSGSGRNIGLEEYDLINGCLVNLGLAPKAASLSKQEQSDLNECLKDVGSSLVKTTSNTSGGSDR